MSYLFYLDVQYPWNQSNDTSLYDEIESELSRGALNETPVSYEIAPELSRSAPPRTSKYIFISSDPTPRANRTVS